MFFRKTKKEFNELKQEVFALRWKLSKCCQEIEALKLQQCIYKSITPKKEFFLQRKGYSDYRSDENLKCDGFQLVDIFESDGSTTCRIWVKE